jgi:hypothetical protein
MIIQNYIVIEDNEVTNIVVWDGDASNWQPTLNSLLMPQSTTPAMLWVLNPSTGIYGLVQSTGSADIGFTWDGEVATTNQPQPPDEVKPESIPVTTP